MSDQPATDTPQMTEAEYRAQIDGILRQYQAQQLHQHMIGPAISLGVHVLGFVVLMAMMVKASPVEVRTYTVTTVQAEVKELKKEIEEVKKEIKPEEKPVEEQPITEVAEDAPTADSPDTAAADVGTGAGAGDVVDYAPGAGSAGEIGGEEALVDSVVTSFSPLKMEGLYAARGSAGARKNAVRKFGGSLQGQEAVEKCLAWLAKVQKPDGSWQASPAHTGLALLVFLAHGETPLSEKYGPTVQKAMQWLANVMMSKPTRPDGTLEFGQNAYGEGIAVYALAEAYGMTRIPFLKTAMEKGIDAVVKGQQPGGGFFYAFARGDKWDLSVSGWQFQAMKAGFAAGSTNPDLEKGIDKACNFLKRTAYKEGKFGYQSPGSGGNMTGVGTTCLILLGEKDAAQAKAGCATIATERLDLYKDVLAGRKDWKKDAGGSIYGWYYDTQALFNRENGSGKEWGEWRKVFDTVLTKNQHPDGYWEVEKGTGMDPTEGGRILTSAWCCLQLEVYYRYLPTFDIKKMEHNKSAKTSDDGSGGLIVQ